MTIPLSPQALEQIRQRVEKVQRYSDSALLSQLLYDDAPVLLAEVVRLQGVLDRISMMAEQEQTTSLGDRIERLLRAESSR